MDPSPVKPRRAGRGGVGVVKGNAKEGGIGVFGKVQSKDPESTPLTPKKKGKQVRNSRRDPRRFPPPGVIRGPPAGKIAEEDAHCHLETGAEDKVSAGC
jgi:hypothetical protein